MGNPVVLRRALQRPQAPEHKALETGEAQAQKEKATTTSPGQAHTAREASHATRGKSSTLASSPIEHGALDVATLKSRAESAGRLASLAKSNSSPAAAPTSTAAATPPATPGGSYTVQSGDTLSGIAQRHGVSLAQLLQANPQITNPSLIHPGQQITIPGGAQPAPAAPPPASPSQPAAPSQPTAPAPAPAPPPPATAAAAGNGQYQNFNGEAHNFIGGNYTDLGRLADGRMPNPLDPAGAEAMRVAAREDLTRLREQGVTDVRIWAGNVPGGESVGGLDNPQAMAARVNILAEEARALGMTLTVDLFDGNTVGNKNVNEYRAMDGQLNNIIDSVVGQNARHDNINWSVGNEIGDPNNPMGFADWYVEKASRIRQAGCPGTRVSAQLVPGSVNHPFASPVYEAAARKIIAASDVVGIHFYPHGNGPGHPDDHLDYNSILKWNDLCKQMGKPMIIGEFNVHHSARSDEAIQNWLQHFKDIGVDHVSLWQFMKNEGGHIDEESFDSLRGRDYIGLLRDNGWID